MGENQSIKSLNDRLPVHGWIGLVLIVVSWILNWSLSGLRTHLLFFPLWLGYCLTVDALVYLRKGSSMFKRSLKAYVGLFFVSAPAWWLFELINLRTQNWFYIGREFFSDIQYFALATLSFSTVIPAVFGTAEFVGTLRCLRGIRTGWRIEASRSILVGQFVLGCLMLMLLLSWPRHFFPLVWLSVYFMLEPLNVWLGNRSLYQYLVRGDWRPVVALWIGVLICGFFWEMWNFHSHPKWVYDVPFVGFLRVFEMPILGYGGYLPFSLELFALYHLVVGLIRRNKPHAFVQLCSS